MWRVMVWRVRMWRVVWRVMVWSDGVEGDDVLWCISLQHLK